MATSVPHTAYSPRVAIITGAAQGIGRETALRLAEDGLDVALNDIPSKTKALQGLVDEIKAKGRNSIFIVGDVSSEEDVKNIVSTTAEKLGSVDVMVANAGIGAAAELLEMEVAEFDRVIAINVRGVMLSYKYAAEQMVKQGRGGRIIGASSVLGKQGGPGFTAYSASKFAVRGMTQAAAKELAPHAITVNAYAPGVIKTDMINHPQDNELGGPGGVLKWRLGLQPDAPDADPSVIASIVSYLVKPEAYFITGQAIPVTGGVYME
ncbi:hypothetical protein NLI96_g10115 [Meripilus lineatus]|uniref:Uncharacterized protein n=1 Tax=Meripilus lineatus TaxID=2056292 RepID=A0AAD5UWH8_9APHY|nr:hypothetical protein NLI96_g10115 [Physisporinus lineatus]